VDSGVDAAPAAHEDASAPHEPDSGSLQPEPPDGELRLVGVGSFGLRGRSDDAATWSFCGSPAQGDEHTPELLRAVAYGAGTFIAVGGDMNGRVMRSVDGEHWEEDVHPLSACPDETYPSSCANWMGAVAYLDGVWLAGGGNGATMRSADAGRTWQGLHRDFPEKHIRALAAGAGRFIAGTDAGGVYVSADRGDSWQAKSVWSDAPSYASLQIVYGDNTFIAFQDEPAACFVSTDLGDSWQPCAAAAEGGTSYVHDGKQWLAALDRAYATSPDAVHWTRHEVSTMPRHLLFDGTRYYGRSGEAVYRGATLDTLELATQRAADFRAWTLGHVLSASAAGAGPAACRDLR
jgi:hypothetical protein